MPECLSTEDLRSYLERSLERSARQRTEEHLSRCAACRGRLAEHYSERRNAAEVHRAPPALKRAARRIPRRGGAARRRPRLAGLAAAAALFVAAGLLIWLERPGAPPGSPGAIRSAPPSGPLVLVAPLEGAEAGGASFELRFTPVPGAARYDVTVLDSDGEIVLRQSVVEARWRVERARLAAGRGAELYWYVTAVLEDGGEIESEVWSFVLGPAD